MILNDYINCYLLGTEISSFNFVSYSPPPVFPVINIPNPSITSFSVITPTDANGMIASVASGVSETGFNLWVIVAIVIGLGITFFLFDNVIGILVPEEKRGKVK